MKYIRTKDIIYENNGLMQSNSTTEENAIIVCGGHFAIPVSKIIAKSDTIEELCDCFVEVGLGNPMVVTWEYVLNDEDRRNFDVYGAISTAKGIIYVAKLNDEGQLELL